MSPLRSDDLLLDLYSCPTEAARWTQVMDQICHRMQARSAVVQLLKPDGQRTRSRWMVRDSQSEAARELHDHYLSDAVNPRMLRTPRRGWSEPQGILRDADFFDTFDPHYADLQERLAAVRLGLFISVRIALPDNESLALVLHRDYQDRRDFDSSEEQFAMSFMPHLRNAVQLATALERSRSHARHFDQILGTLRTALIVCHPDGSVCWTNRAADSILDRRGALWMSGDRLVTASAQETTRLRHTLAAVADDEATTERFLKLGADENTLHLKARALTHDLCSTGAPPDSDHSEPWVLITLSEPAAPSELPAELLAELFALTPAEARLAAALSRGATLNEYAAQHQVSVGTTRYQLKQVMAKTQVRKQSQLVQKLYSSVVAQ